MGTLLGSFELIRKLGAGATAEVFLASGPNARGDGLIALKVMLPHLSEDDEARKAFLTEGRTSAVLRHPNIVEIFDVGEIDGRAFLAMELVRGWSASALLKKLRAANEPLPIDEGCELVRQAALGLHFAHEIRGADGLPLGLVHRDVSPQNLIVSESGEVKVADFGLAKATAAQATVTHGLRGKLRYMPPEQLKGEPVDRRADVFALGAVLWELVTGQPLYPGNSEAEIFQQAMFNPQPHPDEVARGLSRALVEVLSQSVERAPERRPATALLLAERLAPLTVAGESATRLGARVLRHFEKLPLTLDEATGKPPTQPVRRRGGLPSPATRLKGVRPPSERDTATALEPQGDTHPALSPVVGKTLVSLDPVMTLAEDVGASANTLSAVDAPRLKWFLPVAIAGVLTMVGVTALVMRARPTQPEVAAPLAPASDDELLVAPNPPQPIPNSQRRTAEDESPAPPVAAPTPPSKRKQGKGTVLIDSTVPAMITLGRTEYGMTPQRVVLAPGKYRFKVATTDGSRSSEIEVTVSAGAVSKRLVQLR